jgi:hypothetical protein
MTLLAAFLGITARRRSVFPQSRTFRRAVRQALGWAGLLWAAAASPASFGPTTASRLHPATVPRG